MREHIDVLIIGAGLSGIGMACHLAKECPQKSYSIIERRQDVGGTWDLFRYPGIRSDSDMMSFGYNFRPWTGSSILADGPSIKNYIAETAAEHSVQKNIQFRTKTTQADWSTKKRIWTVTLEDEASGKSRKVTCNYLISATGYYNHDEGYLPEFNGRDNFKGEIIHPQHWPENFDYKGKRVVVIGSGATAVTLIPAMADDTSHITMLQRSPAYVYSLPAKDVLAPLLRKIMPEDWVYKLSRKRNIALTRLVYKASRRFPKLMRSLLLNRVKAKVGDGVDMAHFKPNYMPWDQRLAAVPDGDLFDVIRQGKASVETDHIDTFTENGILLKSGKELEADIIITATGLNLQFFGGIDVQIDGKPQTMSEKMTYKGVLLQDMPNMAYLFGYTNVSWTLKIDMAADYVCRLLNEMDQRNARVVTPVANNTVASTDSILDSLSAGYVQRGNNVLPRQGDGAWKVTHHLEQDRKIFAEPVTDSTLEWQSAG